MCLLALVLRLYFPSERNPLNLNNFGFIKTVTFVIVRAPIPPRSHDVLRTALNSLIWNSVNLSSNEIICLWRTNSGRYDPRDG